MRAPSDNVERLILSEAEASLGELTDVATRDRIGLRNAVCAYFLSQRSHGVTDAAIVVAVELILRQADTRAGIQNDSQELAQRLVDWCVAANPPKPRTIS